MRVWGVPNHILCDRHLLGQHNEIHKFTGVLRRGYSVEGYLNGLIEVHNLKDHHEETVKEMIRRGMNHQSPFPNDIVLFKAGVIRPADSLVDLLNRCPRCLERFIKIIRSLNE